MQPVYAFLIVLALVTIWNWWIIVLQKRSPDHTDQLIFRAIFWGLLSVHFTNEWDTRVIYFIGFHLAFWFPFNTILNLMRGYAWNYVGQTAWLDKQMRKWPDAALGLSFLSMIIGIGLLIFPHGY